MLRLHYFAISVFSAVRSGAIWSCQPHAYKVYGVVRSWRRGDVERRGSGGGGGGSTPWTESCGEENEIVGAEDGEGAASSEPEQVDGVEAFVGATASTTPVVGRLLCFQFSCCFCLYCRCGRCSISNICHVSLGNKL